MRTCGRCINKLYLYEDTGDINKTNDDEYEDYISAIREELHQDNPVLLVYCDKDEDMWEI